MFSKLFTLLVTVLLISTVSGGIIRDRRAVGDYYYSNGVVNNVVGDGLVGGPTSLGWAQVPHVMSPMFSPVFGK
ncbi:hypothetical protein CAEBREN_20947 [Caenorhabditis brenneri]|uniref:Nematode Specific Peptide family, group E n=1 Tax=Caenorhabditis brenneri TaxID=135651 RepID=G0MCT8_CAEBE|nr:hypothetical protein CAEBREN_20947 [Caenorhabditis brenneri]